MDSAEAHMHNIERRWEILGIFSCKRDSAFSGLCFEEVAFRMVHAASTRISREI